MSDPLDSIRSVIRDCQDAVRWACILEATAPKPGNVYPGRDFADLHFTDFVVAAETTSRELTCDGVPISQRMSDAVSSTRAATGTNVNLGIVLLIGPLVAADQTMTCQSRTSQQWIDSVSSVIDAFDQQDGQNIYMAINTATAGGLGEVDAMDVHSTHAVIDIRSAMVAAKDRDRIALQYATGFADLIQNVVPLVAEIIEQSGDVLQGITRAQLKLLSVAPDTLIERKCGKTVANQVQKRATAVDVTCSESIAQFDEFLRGEDHRLNPGTTADLIAAALFVLLRSPNSLKPRIE